MKEQRDLFMAKLNKRFPNIWTKPSELFKNEKPQNFGVWTGAENSTFVDTKKEVAAFNVYGNGGKTYINEVHKKLHAFLEKEGWYAESYDAGTFFFWKK